MKFKLNSTVLLSSALVALSGCTVVGHHHDETSNHQHHEPESTKRWLAGDHHIHSKYSVKYDESVNPPTTSVGSDGKYSTALNAQMGYKHGLSWMVTTDHGGPNHSKMNLEQAYPELVASRTAVPGIIQFYGMELDVPGAQHASLIIPHSHNEAQQLHHLEKKYDRKEVFPYQESRDQESLMLTALDEMDSQAKKPIVIANHPGRYATGLGEYKETSAKELRTWNDTAPEVAIGMEGAPGHQAETISPAGTLKENDIRGSFSNYPTMGGFDQMTAKLGGFWDSMLGEGRRWWITSTSDSHIHYTEGGHDFWPGEYSKTYVYAEKNYDDIMKNMRNGHIFVTTGDLISELYVSASVVGKHGAAQIGDSLAVEKGDSVILKVKFLDPESNNANFENPRVSRVDVISGLITGLLNDKSTDTHMSTKVAARYEMQHWTQVGDYKEFTYSVNNITSSMYFRVRGTNGNELEPELDPKGENPWSDLWFYSNPIFIEVTGANAD